MQFTFHSNELQSWLVFKIILVKEAFASAVFYGSSTNGGRKYNSALLTEKLSHAYSYNYIKFQQNIWIWILLLFSIHNIIFSFVVSVLLLLFLFANNFVDW